MYIRNAIKSGKKLCNSSPIFFFNSYSSDIYTVLGLFAKSLTHLFLVLTY